MTLFNKKSGVLLHITSLPSEFGIGDFGPDAYRFADNLKKSKQKFWQILPITPTTGTKGYSPYASISGFAGNTALISPLLLYENGYLKKEDFLMYAEEFKGKAESSYVDYPVALKFKNRFLNKAFSTFQKNNGTKNEAFDKFCSDNDKTWLDNYAIFSALKNRNNNISWRKWPEDLKKNENIKDKFRYAGKLEIQKEKFFQFVFFHQWHNLKSYCNDIGIKLIGDVPIYVDYESSDVWSNPGIFKLYKNKKPRFVSGVPPDYFSSAGQLWNNPVYDWKILKKLGFQWWIDRIVHNLELFDYIRLDHFRGLVKYWEVKAGETTAKNGKWRKAEPEEFFNLLRKKLKERFDCLPVIAEDLGLITNDVKKIMRKYDFPGIRVILFGFGNDFPKSIHLPENYSPDCVAYTGTHDNNTVCGFFKSEAGKQEKINLSKYLKKNSDFNNISYELISRISASRAGLVIFPMQDILGLDEKARMNKPSTSRKNWRWRLKRSQLATNKFEKLKFLTVQNNRG